MLWLPLGLSIFIPAVRFDRSIADWSGIPVSIFKAGAIQAKAGNSWDGESLLFYARLIIPF